jgi:hypothetical protein
MPQVLNIWHLPGFAEHRPIIPPDAVYLSARSKQMGKPVQRQARG